MNHVFNNDPEDLIEEIETEMESISDLTSNTGTVLEVKDGIITVSGMDDLISGGLVIVRPIDIIGMCLNMSQDNAQCILFGSDVGVKQGLLVESLDKTLQVDCFDEMLGTVRNALGESVSFEESQTYAKKRMLVERKAPGVITRESVTEPMLTGYKVIDSMFPIGQGQRELIIGDRQTGKTTIAVDTIINQSRRNINNEIEIASIYVGIGQKASSIREVENILHNNNAKKSTCIVFAGASESASMQFIAPYTGCAIAEYFRDTGRHSLIVYDDLTKHANSYRQLSLLLRRPPGREAFPGDIFYIHSRLLERACKLNEAYGSGSMTALPIIETQAGDLSGYIPTNVISITDGQLFLEKELFFKGIRPAVNVGMSVSRIGSKAQPYPLKIATGNLRFQLAQYREYAVFAQFENDIDPVTKGILDHGHLLTEVLKQSPNNPLNLYEEVIILLAAINGYITEFISNIKNLSVVSNYETSLFNFIKNDEDLYSYFGLFYELLPYGDKEDIKEEENPLTFLLDYFQTVFETDVVLNETN